MSELSHQAKIRQGLIQYIGAFLTANDELTPKQSRQVMTASLAEEATKLCKDKDGKGYDMFVAKPILRAAAFLLEERKKEAMRDAKVDNLQKIIEQNFDATIKFINAIVNSAMEEKNDVCTETGKE